MYPRVLLKVTMRANQNGGGPTTATIAGAAALQGRRDDRTYQQKRDHLMSRTLRVDGGWTGAHLGIGRV